MKYWIRFVIVLIGSCGIAPSLFAQCMYYPVSLQERVNKAEYIVLGQVTGRETYPDPVTGNIQTLNKLQVKAWLKNQQATREVYVITLGGVYHDRMTRVWPSLQLDGNNEYVLFLDKETFQNDNKAVRSQRPNALQVMAYADAQGALPYQDGMYTDLLSEKPMDEATLFARIQTMTRQNIVTPGLQGFDARQYVAPPSGARVEAVSSFSPASTHAGTIVTGDFVTITGAGFGNTPGTVSFRNADNGGSSYIEPSTTTDYVSWSDNSITVKVPDNAGSGDFLVNNSLNSPGNLTITYAHYSATDDFQGFSANTRQRIYLRNLNNQGGYSFFFNNSFASNTQATEAYARALSTWRCATGVNFVIGGTTPIASNLNDGTNVVFFDATLSAGTLAQTVSNFSATANGSCTLFNTVWWFSDMDLRVRPTPGAAATWNFAATPPATSQYDFESIALHELGHAHGLGHVIAPGQVMHYAIKNGDMIRTLSANDIAGGNAKMAYSTANTCFNPTNSGTPMVPVPATSCATSDVKFIKFEGHRVTSETNSLSWITENEVNSMGFYVQRSADAVTFTDLGFVPTKGPGSARFDYTFNDDNTGSNSWYYRLRQMDVGGKQKFSDTILITGDVSAAWQVYGSRTGTVLQANGPTTGAILVFSASGQLVYKGSLQSGNNRLVLPKATAGIYFCRFITPTATFTKKVAIGVVFP